MDEKKKKDDANSDDTSVTTQDVVPDLIAALFRANKEDVQPSEGPLITVTRDPHLRLRRTLTPSSPIRGLKKYNEAQFMISTETETTGQRLCLTFSALGGHEFHMDAYVWGATEDEAEQRMVTLHGISPGVSRTRWHCLGDRIGKLSSATGSTKRKIRFVALDWHSIDRTDKPQDAFLTMLPKHMYSVTSNADTEKEIIAMYPEEDREKVARDFFQQVRECCPRSSQDGAHVLRAVIEQGLGWGIEGRPFVLGVKSWSGALGMELLAETARRGDSFRDSIAGVVLMHPAYFPESEDKCKRSLEGLSVLMCWARDDPLVPYQISSRYLVHDRVKLVTYDNGGHANFDGSKNLPNFDDEILNWLEEDMQ